MDELNNIYGDYQPPTRLEKVADGLRKWGHRVSLFPYFGAMPGTIVTAIASGLSTLDGFFNKSFATGSKRIIEGAADTAATALGSFTGLYYFNWIGTLATGSTFGELAREGTQGALDSVIGDKPIVPKETELARQMKVLGNDPMTYGYAPAAVAYAPSMQQQMMPAAPPRNPATGEQMQPNQWTNAIARQRGQSPEEARANWMRNNHEDAIALQRAGQIPAEIGAS